jgi:hypothetical protein
VLCLVDGSKFRISGLAQMGSARIVILKAVDGIESQDC